VAKHAYTPFRRENGERIPMVRSAAAAVIAALVVALAPLAASDASTTAPGTAPPNPCKTFTLAAARTLLGAGRNTALTEKRTTFNNGYEIRGCTIKYHSRRLAVQTQRHPGAFGSVTCYRHRRLGSYGRVCLSATPTYKYTFSVFRKNGVYYSAGVNEQLPSHGAKIYTFALAQYKIV
jgi:hypothetical protein